MNRARVCSLAIVAIVGAAPIANAEPAAPPAASGGEARRLFQEGVARADRRDHEGARQAFAASYDLDPRPEALFALAQSERLLGRCDAAIPHYERFIETATRPQQLEAARIALGRCRGETPAPMQAPPVLPDLPDAAPVVLPTDGSPLASTRSRALPWSLAAGAIVALGTSATLFMLSSAHAEDAPREEDFGDYVARGEAARLERGFALGAGAAGIIAAVAAGWVFWDRAAGSKPAGSLGVGTGPPSLAFVGRF